MIFLFPTPFTNVEKIESLLPCELEANIIGQKLLAKIGEDCNLYLLKDGNICLEDEALDYRICTKNPVKNIEEFLQDFISCF
jgi:hypothetical protein